MKIKIPKKIGEATYTYIARLPVIIKRFPNCFEINVAGKISYLYKRAKKRDIEQEIIKKLQEV